MEALKLINDQFLGVWDIYIKFYTAFLTVNLVALGLVVEKVKQERARKFICVGFMIQNLFSLITASGMAMYSNQVAHAFLNAPEIAVLAASRPLGVWGGIGNALSHVLFIGLWAAVCWFRLPLVGPPDQVDTVD